MTRVRKSTGETEAFDEGKLRRALRRSGASRDVIDRVVQRVEAKLVDGMSTRKLYRIAYDALRSAPKPVAARFDLQRAVRQLGPNGYPFEQFVGALIEAQGYHVVVGAQLRGRFVTHEIDVDARRKTHRLLAECKFRNESSGKVDVKIALYVYARSLDLEPVGFDEFWLVTNGRFTDDARSYGEGVGLHLVSWHHPEGGNLERMIDRAQLHPLTCLTTLRARDKATLLDRGIVLCRDLRADPRVLDGLRIGGRDRERVRQELDGLAAL